MKQFLSTLLVFVLFPSLLFAGEIRMSLYHESFEGGYHIFADNNEFCPVSVTVSFELTNMQTSLPEHKIIIIPARTTKLLIADLKVADPHAAYKFRYNYKTNYGNAEQTSFEKDYAYQLPFPKGASYKVFQGYYGKQTHQGIDALDFSLNEGSSITAVRSGVVVRVVETNNAHCIAPECAKLNNYILIYHSDGTFASYAHIQQNGARVAEGDSVKQGQLIGLSGDVGRTDGPHLHLEIFLQALEKRTSLPTYFLTGDGKSKEYLKEGSSYLRNY
jgi:murein DD-endopeptidase MepM/ murein hydrolase activator NlpD